MRKVIRLASMDLRTENSKDVALFFTLFNEMLQKAIGKPDYKFNPCYFLCDEGGANHNAIKIVYGEDFCKERVVDASGNLGVMQTKNQRNCQKICMKYSTKSVRSSVNPQQLLANTTSWRPSWKKWPRSSPHYSIGSNGGMPDALTFLSLLGGRTPWCKSKWNGKCRLETIQHINIGTCCEARCSFYDATGKGDLLVQQKYGKSTGRGPSKTVRNSREWQEEIKIAEDFANILDDEEAIRLEAEQAENPSAFIPNGNSKHRPPQSIESYDVQAESKKVRKKTMAKDKPTTTTINRKKKTCNPEIEDGCFTENLALATEIIGQKPTNEETSQTPGQPFVPSGLAQYIERNPPVVINPVGRGIRKCNGCGEKSQMQSNHTQTTWCSAE